VEQEKQVKAKVKVEKGRKDRKDRKKVKVGKSGSWFFLYLYLYLYLFFVRDRKNRLGGLPAESRKARARRLALKDEMAELVPFRGAKASVLL